MPCDSIRTTQIDLSKASVDVLASALAELGFTISTQTADKIVANNRDGATVIWDKGSGTTIRQSAYDRSKLADLIAPAYSKAALKTAAKKFGWDWKQDKTNNNVFEVTRR